MTERRPDDGDPFNAGWNACLAALREAVKKLPTEGVADDRVRALIAKRDVLDLLDCIHGEGPRNAKEEE